MMEQLSDLIHEGKRGTLLSQSMANRPCLSLCVKSDLCNKITLDILGISRYTFHSYTLVFVSNVCSVMCIFTRSGLSFVTQNPPMGLVLLCTLLLLHKGFLFPNYT